MKKLTKKINEIVMLMELQALNNLDRKTGECKMYIIIFFIAAVIITSIMDDMK